MFKLIEIDPNLPLSSLSCELGQNITRYRFIGGQASGTPDHHDFPQTHILKYDYVDYDGALFDVHGVFVIRRCKIYQLSKTPICELYV